MTSMEEDDEAEVFPPKGAQSLVDLVFSWSIHDVLNKDLYKDKVFAPSLSSSTPLYLWVSFLLLTECLILLGRHRDCASNLMVKFFLLLSQTLV